MKTYKIVKKEESPTININEVSFENGFIIVTSDGEVIGIIVHDTYNDVYAFINHFRDDFYSGVNTDYSDEELEELMKRLTSEYSDPVEFNFVRVEE
jgi:hypothetical protein